MATHHKKNWKQPQKPEETQKMNEAIKAPKVRLVGDNIEPGIYPTSQALQMAREKELDLVQITDGKEGEAPICKIMDYQKFLFEKKKKQKRFKANASKVVIKEIRFGPETEEHDYNFKKKHVLKFLQEGAKVKAIVFFKGRTNYSDVHKEKGKLLLLNLAQDMIEYGKLEQNPAMEGRRMFIFISPKKKK